MEDLPTLMKNAGFPDMDRGSLMTIAQNDPPPLPKFARTLTGILSSMNRSAKHRDDCMHFLEQGDERRAVVSLAMEDMMTSGVCCVFTHLCSFRPEDLEPVLRVLDEEETGARLNIKMHEAFEKGTKFRYAIELTTTATRAARENDLFL